ncbi:MAG: hypothetical protein M0015_07940 [Betaproteobacteria bacterium]|nr:hypothetical protein [Betaproteobacteria bacterium]
MSTPLLERLECEHGELRDGATRYLLVRHDSLMGMFARLRPEARRAAFAALADSLAEHGARSAQRYAAALPQGSEQLLAVIEATAPQLGWGRWRFERRGEEIGLTVENSPFAAGYGRSEEPVCAAIAGMLRAVAGLTLGATAAAEEHRCAAVAGTSCGFRAWRRAA